MCEASKNPSILNIQGFQKTTLLDFPGYVSATVFMGGCSFRCPFCHNRDLVEFPNLTSAFSKEEILSYLKKRQGILDGVCITGGEPTLQPELEGFMGEIKQLGFLVKLDTNGYQPDILKNMCQKGLVDYVAMDIKGTSEKYPLICGAKDIDMSRIQASIDFLLAGTVAYEFRTTVVREFHMAEDFTAIGKWIAGAQAYYLQGYVDSPQVISPGFSSYNREELAVFQKILQNYIPRTEIRGVDH